MTSPASFTTDTSPDEAARWHVLLHSDDATEADWAAFTQWLEQPEHKNAYDTIDLALAIASDNVEAVKSGGQEGRDRRVLAFVPRARAAWVGGALALLAACAVLAIALWPQATGETYFAAPATSDSVVHLADNTEIHLNRGARIRARLGPTARNVTLERGEASFTVTHDPSRPFAVAVNGAVVQDIGTEFNIAPAGPAIVVTVRSGSVAISTTGRADAHVEAGEQARIDAREIVLSGVNPGDAFAWQDGHLLYHNATLSQIAEDISNYGPEAIEVDPNVANLRFSGVLAIGEQSGMLQQLRSFLPVRSEQNGGRIVLRGRL